MGVFQELSVSIQSLIDELGRTVSYRTPVGSSKVDPARPWLGVTPRYASTLVRCVFDAYSTAELRGTEVQDNDVKVYVSSLSLGSIRPAPGDVIVDGAQEMRVMRVVKYQPNEDLIAYELQIRPS